MAQNRNISSSFEDLVSSSDLVSSGSPDVYQLKGKKDKIGSLTRVTVGEKHETRANKTVLLVGETGTGKSTLVNALVNYAVGVKFDDELWFQIVDRSQSSGVIVYQIFGFEDQILPFSLTIIDTPGYGDAAALDHISHNTRINQQLMELFQSDDGVHEVHAVGLVMKEGENPVSDRLKNIYDFIKSLFGEDVEENIVALMTNSQGREPEDVLQALEAANIKCAKDEENETVYFQFDNLQDKKRTKKSKTSLGNAWRVTESGMEELTAFLEKSSPHHRAAMLEEQREQIRLTACIQNLQERIRFTDLKLRDVERTQEAVYEGKLKMESYQNSEEKNLHVVTPETYKELEPVRDATYGYETAVYCLICKENCHYPGCTEASHPEQCEVMIDGKCTSCTNKCPASDHVTKNWRYEIRTKKVLKNKEALKHPYRLEAGEKKLKLSERLEREKIKLSAERKRLINEVFTLFIELCESAKNEDSAEELGSSYVIFDFLNKKMKGQEDEEKLLKLKEMFERMEEGEKGAPHPRMVISSSNQEALISESYRLHPGPPAVYQLIPKKETIGTLSRLMVGERDEMKINKTILLVGETGAGKSTLINALFNYAVGVKFEDEVWFKIVEEEERESHESQTSDVFVYQIFGYEGQTLPFSLTIVDTPGYGDTRGKKHDDDIIQRLCDLFGSKDGIHEINAVGLVMKATDNRLSDRLRYVFDSVMSLFGNDLEKNIVVLITHSDGKTPENALQALDAAQIKCSKDEKNQPVHFMFNNQQTEKYTTEREKLGSEHSWGFTNEQMDRFSHFLDKTKPQPMTITVEVLNERIKLKACIQNLKERIQENELKQREIRQINDALKIHEEMENDNFTIVVDEPYKDKKTIYRGLWWMRFVFYKGAVTCSVCEENCHYPGCTMALIPEYCKVMKDGHCTVCTNRCPASDHVKAKWIYVIKTRKVKKTLEDMKKRYEKNYAECKSLLDNVEKETTELTAERSMLLDQAYNHVTRLEQIALKVDSESTLVHLDFLIEKMKERGDREKVKNLEEMKMRMNRRK